MSDWFFDWINIILAVLLIYAYGYTKDNFFLLLFTIFCMSIIIITHLEILEMKLDDIKEVQTK